MPRDKSRYRDKRSSSYSSDDSYERKKSRSKHKRRSRSRDRSESSRDRRKRSTSRSRHKRRSHSRSKSRDRYEKPRRRSSSRSRSKRDRSHSRSSSRSRSKYSKSKKSLKKRSSSRSSSLDIGNTAELYSEDLCNKIDSLSEDLGRVLDTLLNSKFIKIASFLSKRPIQPKRVNLDDTESKVEKAIKAAEAAGLTMTKIPTYEYKEVEIKEDMPTIHDRNLLAELNSDSFVQRSFTSSRTKKESSSIVIDLNTQTVTVPESEIKQNDDSIINFDEIPNEEELKEMWIKKLYQYRKRMLKGEI